VHRIVVCAHDALTSCFHPQSRDWADDDENEEVPSTALPNDETIQNRDGTKTIISYRLNENGQTVKTTRRIRLITHREVVNPRVAERKKWSKFGLSGNDPAGPAPDTTSVGENIIFRPSANWKQEAKDESKDPNAQSMKDKLKDKKVKCRICSQEHFTARCPYKETMAPVGESAVADVAAGMGDDPAAGAGTAAGGAGGAGAGKKGSYVPPALRNGGARGEGERMGGKFGERDDFATLRVTNVCVLLSLLLVLSLPLLNCIQTTHKHTHKMLTVLPLFFPLRSPRWQRSKSSATCLSASAASLAYSWPRTGRRAGPRASLLLVLPTGPTPRGPAARWTALVSSTLSSRLSLQRRLPRWLDLS
jgi:translation initiation factor 3 subunit G